MYEDIREKEYAINEEIEFRNNLPNIYPIVETTMISEKDVMPKTYTETELFDEADNETEKYLEYSNTVKVNDRYYLITIRHSLVEKEDLIAAISIPLLILLLLLFTISFMMTKRFNKTLWADFEKNLKAIEAFSFTVNDELNLKETTIDEFDRLNRTIENLIDKLNKDYHILKQFTENASHEIQTPVSIALINLEEALQYNLPENAFKQVVKAIEAIKRLSALNDSLILLTKIENNQFSSDSDVVFNEVFEEKLKLFSGLLKGKNLKVRFNSNGKFICRMNLNLANILVNNLFSNAVNHNVKDGLIEIEIRKQGLRICNSGEPNSLNNDTIFRRFTKEKSRSYGLGLAIVKQICDKHGLEISYSKNELHCFDIHQSSY
jgi:signal transduction histidine kinase